MASPAGASQVWWNFQYWVVFVANDSSHAVLLSNSSDGFNWSAPIQTNQRSQAAPSLTVFNDQLWIAFIADDSSNQILLCFSGDGTNWSGTVTTGQSSRQPVGLAVTDSRLAMAFISNDGTNSLLAAVSADGKHWSMGSTGQTCQGAPGLSSLNGRLWVVFQANDSSNTLLTCSSGDGLNWSGLASTGQSSKLAPNLVTYNNQLWMAFVANDSSNTLYVMSSSDGSSWSGLTNVNQSSKTSPSLSSKFIQTGTIQPKYHVLSVMYAPPGTEGKANPSSVSYSTGSSLGTTVSTTSAFKSTVKVEAEGTGGGASFGYSHSSSNTDSIQITKTEGSTETLGGPSSDGIDHNQDRFSLWLNPILTVTIGPGKAVNWKLGVSDGPMRIQEVTVAQLKNPALLSPGVKADFDKVGMTTDDFATILALNPFAASANYVPDPNRYEPLSQSIPYDPPYSDQGLGSDAHSYTVSTANINASSQTLESKYSVGVKLNLDFGVFKLKSSTELEWTNSSTDSTSTGSTQSATVTITGPAYGYTGPTDVLVYWDKLYNTFAFTLTSG